jgi:hypothetical protein
MNVAEKPKAKIIQYAGYTIVAIILLLSIAWIRKFIMIDICLDHGGRWNYETNECEGERRSNATIRKGTA